MEDGTGLVSYAKLRTAAACFRCGRMTQPVSVVLVADPDEREKNKKEGNEWKNDEKVRGLCNM